jgi:hypothetical protein
MPARGKTVNEFYYSLSITSQHRCIAASMPQESIRQSTLLNRRLRFLIAQIFPQCFIASASITPRIQDTLMHLPAFDHPNGGITHAVALDCLTIIAANAVGGYLTRTKDGPAINTSRYDVLTEAHYYFVVPYPAGESESFLILICILAGWVIYL